MRIFALYSGMVPHIGKKYTEALEKVQMRATKITINNKELSYPERLQILDIPTLVYRRH
jgi:hypothetical protein